MYSINSIKSCIIVFDVAYCFHKTVKLQSKSIGPSQSILKAFRELDTKVNMNLLERKAIVQIKVP